MQLAPVFLFFILACASLQAQSGEPALWPKALKIERKKLKVSGISLKAANQAAKTTDFYYGQRIQVSFDGLKGLKKEKNEHLIGLSAYMRDSIGALLVAFEDLNSDNNRADAQAESPYGFFRLGPPLHSGASYQMDMKLWDKLGKGEINLSFPFRILPDPGYVYEARGLTLREAYIWNETPNELVLYNQVRSGLMYLLFLEGVEGWVEKEGKAHPGVEIRMMDDKGQILAESPDVFAELEPVEVAGIKERFNLSFRFPTEVAGKAGLLYIRVFDKNSDKSLVLNYRIELDR